MRGEWVTCWIGLFVCTVVACGGSSSSPADATAADATAADARPPPDATAIDAMPPPDAGPPYPAGPYGVAVGDVIADLWWIGYADGADAGVDPFDEPSRVIAL